ncbi:hypothetical protein BDN67DRAFT_1035498 [Paxillus ammoniavirescens]|nr:hypothetical protein BDN67DRAFT_1035498 [Paxillus ammoniavirescens]
MTDLAAFNVTSFPSGQQNVDIVAKIPPHALAPAAKLVQNSISLQNGTNQSSILQLVYPAHSVNPGSKPAGGADFYAAPLNLTAARNVTLEYSVFFPADFDWVKGGKLPGLYGGHTGCSGGSSAKDCFSTRLMWRPNGVGELYLYAPKDKQSEALCADPQSVCDSSYGFSVGRGSFSFTAGDWTNLRQNVVLNTPGQQDGVFTLLVDGKAVINRTDMFYRDATQQAKQKPFAVVLIFRESTFFGGHGEEYATPKDQYTWFKDFAIKRHA